MDIILSPFKQLLGGDGARVRETVGGTQVDYVGNFYEYSETTSSVPEQLAGALRYGINCYDAATGSGYLMYSEESVHERFSAHPPDANDVPVYGSEVRGEFGDLLLRGEVGRWLSKDA